MVNIRNFLYKKRKGPLFLPKDYNYSIGINNIKCVDCVTCFTCIICHGCYMSKSSTNCIRSHYCVSCVDCKDCISCINSKGLISACNISNYDSTPLITYLDNIGIDYILTMFSNKTGYSIPNNISTLDICKMLTCNEKFVTFMIDDDTPSHLFPIEILNSLKL